MTQELTFLLLILFTPEGLPDSYGLTPFTSQFECEAAIHDLTHAPRPEGTESHILTLDCIPSSNLTPRG